MNQKHSGGWLCSKQDSESIKLLKLYEEFNKTIDPKLRKSVVSYIKNNRTKFGKILYKVGMFENKMGKDNGSVSNTGNYIGTPWGIILCVDYYRDEKINGRIYHRYQTEPIRVGGMTEAVFEIDAFFDRLGYPFPGTESHYFIKHEKKQRIKMARKLSDEEMLKNNGEKGTFIIRVEQRQHSSWQGRVTWVEEGKTENFRSALELLKMIDGALGGMDIKEDAEEENQERAG